MKTAKEAAIDCVQAATHAQPVSLVGASASWVPSRFNARSQAPDGTLILYNSYTGAFSGFPSKLRGQVEALLHRNGFRGRCEGLTKYLSERGYLVPRGTNELQRARLQYGAAQHRSDRLELILLSSEECNFRCVYCYETFPRGTMAPWVREAVIKMVERRMPTLNSFSADYFGGEPLLGFEAIEEMAPVFKRLADEHHVHHGSTMTTNGYLLTPERFEKLIQWNVLGYQITLDGAPADHDQHRVLKEGGPTFNVILDNLRAMRTFNAPFRVALRVNFDPTNLPRIPDFLEAMAEFKHDKRFVLRFYPVGRWGGTNDDSLQICGLSGEAQRQRLDVLAAEQGHNPESRMPYLKSQNGMNVCYAARPHNLLIGADGKIMKCTIALDTKDHNIVGKMTRDGRAEIDVDKMLKWVAPYFEDDTACKRCFYLPVCQGCSCPLPRVETGERPCPPEKLQIRKTLISVWDVKNRTANRYDLEAQRLRRAETTAR